MRRSLLIGGLTAGALAVSVSVAVALSMGRTRHAPSPEQVLEKFHNAVIDRDYHTACEYAVARPYQGDVFLETHVNSVVSSGLRRTSTVTRRIALHGCRSFLSDLDREGGGDLVGHSFEVLSSKEYGRRALVCVRLTGHVGGINRSQYELVATPTGWRVRFAIPAASC